MSICVYLAKINKDQDETHHCNTEEKMAGYFHNHLLELYTPAGEVQLWSFLEEVQLLSLLLLLQV